MPSFSGATALKARGPERDEYPDRAAAAEAAAHLVGRDPRQLGEDRTRWTLAAIGRACPWLAGYSDSGVWRALDALDVHWRRGRQHVRSPDPLYAAKLARVAHCRARAGPGAAGRVLLFEDELTYYRQPSVGFAFGGAGGAGPPAELSHARNTPTRVAATLEPATGRVVALQADRLGVGPLVGFYEQLCAAYPGRRLYLVQDNWPVHFHPDVLAALEPQANPFPWVYPRNWPTAPSPRARRLGLPIQLLPLPTYASWCNPIEKLWRWLKQAVLHLHPWAADLPELRRRVLAFLARFHAGSHDLLRYVGLLVPK